MIKHLIIPSGSTSGLIMLGIFKQLMCCDYFKMSNIESIHATSVGTIIAVLLALDFDWKTVYDYIIERPWEKVIDFNPLHILQTVANKGCFCSNELCKKFFLPLFQAKDIDISITLQQFYKLTNIDLFFYTCNLQNMSLVELSYKSHPDLELVKAITMSSSLPIVC